MKALTLWRPWPAAICYFGKRVENRTWCPPAYLLGQDLAIHAGVRIDEAEVEDLIYNEDDARAVLPGHMGIVAIVRVAGVIDAGHVFHVHRLVAIGRPVMLGG